MIIEKARELGIALSESDEFKRLTAAREALEAEPDVLASLDSYNHMQQEIMDEMSGDGNAQKMTALSADMERTKDALFENKTFVEMIEAQNAFEALMKRVNRAIGMSIGMDSDSEDDGEGCTHDCSSCGGCVH